MWSLYNSIQQKLVGYYSQCNRNVWKKTIGDRNYLKQKQKSVEFLLFRSQFSSSVRQCEGFRRIGGDCPTLALVSDSAKTANWSVGGKDSRSIGRHVEGSDA